MQPMTLLFAAQLNLDAVGTTPAAWVSTEAWSRMGQDSPGLVATDTGLDAIALRGPAHPKAPKRVDVADIDATTGATLLLSYQGDLSRGAPVVRLTRALPDGGTAFTDLRAGDGIFPLNAAGSSDTVTAVWTEGDRALSRVQVGPGSKLTIEVRDNDADVVIFGVSAGRIGEIPRVAPTGLAGFPFPLTITSPAPPRPSAWAVPPQAGANGAITIRDGHLAHGDGTRARFWGINLLNAACYPTHEIADALATQLAANGFNLVRLHHFDSDRAGGVNPDRKSAADPLFLDDGLDRFDYLVSRLEAAGIYILLETATNRTFTAADGVNEPGPLVPSGHKVLPMFAPAWRKAYFDWATAWLGRTNRYTGKAYAQDPGVAMVELTNENSLLVMWLSGGVERLAETHRAELDRQWNEFVRARYPTDAAIAQAWTGSVNPQLRPGETLGRVERMPSGQGTFNQWPTARVADLYDFYLGLETRFFDDLAAHVRGLGFKVPLVPGITYDNPAFAQVMSRFDVVDTHLEWDAPAGGNLRNDSIVGRPRSQNFIERFRNAQVGKPMMVSELNEGFPNDQQAEAPLLWASLASVQDWDALVWLSYTNGPIDAGPGPVGSFSDLRFNSVKWAQMAAASGLFRSGAVAPAPGLFPMWRSLAAVKAETVEQDRPTWPLLRDVSTLLSSRLREAYGGAAPAPIAGKASTSLGWWPGATRFVVQTDALEAVLADHGMQARAGRGEGSGPTNAAHLDPQLDGFAAVSLTCMEGTVATCRRGLLTVAGQMENRGMQRIAGGSTVLDNGAEAGVLSRPAGKVRFAWTPKPDVRPLDVNGKLGAPIPVVADGKGWWSVDMAGAGDTVWWQVGG